MFRIPPLKIFQSKAKFATSLPAFSLFLPPTLKNEVAKFGAKFVTSLFGKMMSKVKKKNHEIEK